MQKENILVKKDISTNWEKAKNFIPKSGEIIIYTDFLPQGMKIGDGITKVNNLPFVDANEYSTDGETLIIDTKLF